MRFTTALATLALAPLVLVSSCSKDKSELSVAKIGDRSISVRTFENTYFRMDPKYLPETTDLDGRLELLDTMIDKDVMAIKADALGYDKDEYVVRGMEAFEKVGLQAGYLKVKVSDKVVVTDKDLKEWYNNFGVIYHIKQVLVDTREEADYVRQLLVDGQDFESVCREYSKGPDAEQGGQILNAQFGTFPPNFQDALFSTEVGDVPEPILSKYGYFIIKVVGEKRPQQQPYESVRDNIEKLVRNHKTVQASMKMSQDIRDKNGFEIYEQNVQIILELLPPDRLLTDPPNRDTEIYPLLRVQPQDLDKPLVTWNAGSITIRDFSDLYDRSSFFRRPRREARMGGITQFLTELVMNDLIVLEIEQSGIENEPEVALLLQKKREQLMVDKLYQDLVDRQTTISQNEINDYYRDNMELFHRDQECRFAYVLTGDKESALKAHEMLKNGRNFDAVVTRFHIEELTGGTMSSEIFVQKGTNPDLDEYAFDLQVGGYSQPFDTDRGWLIVKVVEKRPERILPVTEATHDITRYLKSIKNEDRLNELLAKWREEIPIEINESNLMKADLDSRPSKSVRFS